MFPIRLRCPACNYSQRADVAAASAYLQSLGMLRRRSDPSPTEVRELLLAALPRIACPKCNQPGLEEAATSDSAFYSWEEEWPEARMCDECNAPIHPERLEIFPDTRLCTACQRRDETGAPNLAEDVYCPSCGSPMRVKPRGGHGVTRYVWVCSNYPACRGGSA